MHVLAIAQVPRCVPCYMPYHFFFHARHFYTRFLACGAAGSLTTTGAALSQVPTRWQHSLALL